jgi:Fic family protein
MTRLLKRTWTPSDLSGMPRRDRRGCDYDSYVPDPLRDRTFSLSGATAADVSDAEASIRALNQDVHALADTEALARLLLRAEAVASSHIEGLVIGGRRLLRAEAAEDLDEPSSDVTATEVLGNIAAMDHAVHQLGERAPSVDDILELHRLLLTGTDRDEHAGLLRTQQNWIGGSSYNPCSAEFVPPPEDEVLDLLEDLCEFIADDGLPPVAQAAIAHAQFETIHPFIDGNGRTGRALIHVVLRRRGIAPNVVPPISLILATRADDYIAGLTGFRYVGAPDSADAAQGVDHWIATFAAATSRAATDAVGFEQRIRALQDGWRDRLGRIRAGSAAQLLIERLPGAPVLTVNAAAALIDRSFNATNDAIERLAEAGVLTQIKVGRRNRAWEAKDVIDAFTDLERALASPTADTRSDPPTRDVPTRRP